MGKNVDESNANGKKSNLGNYPHKTLLLPLCWCMNVQLTNFLFFFSAVQL